MRNLPFACPSANSFTKDDKEDSKETDQKHNTSEQHSEHQETISKDPGENLVSHTKRQQGLCSDEDRNQFGGVVIVTVDHVSDQHRETDEIGKLEDTEPSEESEPVKFVVGGAGENCHADGRTDYGWKENPKTHLRFANTAVFTSPPGCESI